KQGFTPEQIVVINMMADAPHFLHKLRLLVEDQKREPLRRFYAILQINKVTLLQTDIPKEVIDALTDHDMFWIAQHLYMWYRRDFLQVLECIATAYVDGLGWQWEYDQGGFVTITNKPG